MFTISVQVCARVVAPIFGLLIFLAVEASAGMLSVEDFASLPDVSQLQLSPSGNHIASLVRVKTKERSGVAVSILDVVTRKQSYPVFATNDKFSIKRILWANNTKLLLSAVFPAVRYGTPTTETRLLVVDIISGKQSNVISKRQFERFTHMPQFQDQIVDMMPEDKDHFLLQVDGYSPNEPIVFKVALNRNKMTVIQKSESNIIRWKTDRQHSVRLGTYFKDTHYKIRHRFPEQKKWNTLWEFDSFAANQVWPIGFDKDPNILYVNALHNGRKAIFKTNLRDPELALELVISDDEYDIGGRLLYSNITGEVIGITSSNDKGFIFWDEEYRKLQKSINKALPDTINYLQSLSRNERKYLVLSVSDTEAGVFLFGDRDKKSLLAVAYRYRNLVPELMAKKKEVTYKARDGLEIEAYVTLPIDHKEGKKTPHRYFSSRWAD